MTFEYIYTALQEVIKEQAQNSSFWQMVWLYKIYGKPMLKSDLLDSPTPFEDMNPKSSDMNYKKTRENISKYLNQSDLFTRVDIEDDSYFFSDYYCILFDAYGAYKCFTVNHEVPQVFKDMFVYIPKQKTIKFVYKTDRGLRREAVEINITESDLQLNYNDDLPHDKICNILKEENKSALLILSGNPGTGKTTYLRHLISTLPDCDFNVVGIDDFGDMLRDKTSFITFKNSILIIEDCELLVRSRDAHGALTELAGLLNLADGLYGDIMKAKIICTFNTKIENIDSALLRKGRLSLKYDFKELTPEKKHALCVSLGKSDSETGLLCDIYNSESNGLEQTIKTKIGF